MKKTHITVFTNIFFLLLFFCLHSNTLAQEKKLKKAIITGEINHPKQKQIVIEIRPSLLITQTMKSAVKLDSTGRFIINLEMDKPLIAYINYGKASVQLFMEPNDSLHLTADGQHFMNTLGFAGKKQTVEQNSFLLSFNAAPYNRALNDRNLIRKLSPADFRDGANELHDAQSKKFAAFQKEQDISKAFRGFIQAKIDYPWALVLVNHPYVHRNLNKKKVLPKRPADYYNFLDSIQIQNDEMIMLPEYVAFIDGYLTERVLFQQSDLNKYDFTLLYTDKCALAHKYFKDRSLDYILAKGIYEGCVRGKVEAVKPYYEKFVAQKKYPDYLQLVQQVYEQFEKFGAGNPAPDFTLQNPTGEEVSISDFKGKVVYVDFWATWCGPCKKEMPSSQKLHQRFEDEDIEDVVFLYISQDRSDAPWKKYIEEKELEGVHIYAGDQKRAISKAYNISGIPKFILIGKDGNIADSQAQRPSSEGIYDNIMELLKK